MNEERQTNIAKRVLDLIPYWERNIELTEAEQITELFNMISLDPLDTIEFLLDIIDDLNA